MKGLYQWYLFATLCLLFISCQHKPVSEESSRSHFIQSTAEDYFATYAEREDWEKLCSFYREDVQFEDVMLQLHLDSLWKFKRFYNWPDTGFAKLYPEQKHLVIETLTVNDSMAIARGYINPFYWYGQKMDTEWGMQIAFWLFFDENLKIKRQIDWVEYAPEVFESVIARVRENGVEEVPAWLDLSK